MPPSYSEGIVIAPRSGMKPTILVVDDQPGTRHLLRNVLEREGYRVVEASDEGDAWWAIQQCDHALQLALIDIDLPGRDGRCVADHLRLLQPFRVIFMSGHDRNALLADGRLQQDACWLSKPFRLSDVRETVRRELHSTNENHRAETLPQH
jgi:two-component system aerobic respiration control protein ArcA